MKIEYRVIIASFIFGLSAWIIDAIFDYFYFYEGTFLDLLIFSVPPHEMYIRSTIIICFIIFGTLIAKNLAGQIKIKESYHRANEFNKTLLEAIPFKMNIVDTEGNILFLNKKVKEEFGDDVVGKKCWEVYRDDKKRCNDCPLDKSFQDREGTITEVTGMMGGRSVQINHMGMYYKGKKAVLEIFQDITQRKEMELKLRRLQHNLRTEKQKLEQVLSIDRKISSILNLNHLVDFIVEKATNILEAEKCSLMLFDSTSEELSIRGAKGLDEKIIGKARIKIGDSISGRVAQRGEPLLIKDIEHNAFMARKNRSHYRSKSFLSVPIILRSKLVGVVNVADKNSKKNHIFDETDLKILCSIVHQAAVSIENAYYCGQLEYLSVSDPLTGSFNHRYFTKRLDQEISRTRRYPKPLCLIMADVDDFKSYNDTYGHLKGDELLKELTRVFTANLRRVDVLCRYAGDEFAVILPETNISQAKIIAEKMRDTFNAIDFEGDVSLSFGLAQCTEYMNRYDLIMKSDQALYQAKKEGKNQICSL